MRHLKTLSIGVALALVALLGVGTASATELYKYTTPAANDTLGVNTEIVATLLSGSSLKWEFTGGGLADTCTGSEMKVKLERVGGAMSHPGGNATTMTFASCTQTTDTIAKGELEIQHIAGTTNGNVISKNTEVTYLDAAFGITCHARTGVATTIGTFTGAKASNGPPIIHVNTVLSVEALCGSTIRWVGTYTVTSPLGTTVEAS